MNTVNSIVSLLSKNKEKDNLKTNKINKIKSQIETKIKTTTKTQAQTVSENLTNKKKINISYNTVNPKKLSFNENPTKSSFINSSKLNGTLNETLISKKDGIISDINKNDKKKLLTNKNVIVILFSFNKFFRIKMI